MSRDSLERKLSTVKPTNFFETYRANRDNFDEAFSVETEGLHPSNYGAVRQRVFEDVLKIAPESHSEEIFIDIGCGKGRALLLAATRPFKKIIGVEHSAELCKVAIENVRIARPKIDRPERIEIRWDDAFQWIEKHWPKASPVFLFMYGPFGRDTFSKRPKAYEEFFEIISRKSKKSKTALRLALVNPFENSRNVLGQFDFQIVEEHDPDRLDANLRLLTKWQLFTLGAPRNLKSSSI